MSTQKHFFSPVLRRVPWRGSGDGAGRRRRRFRLLGRPIPCRGSPAGGQREQRRDHGAAGHTAVSLSDAAPRIASPFHKLPDMTDGGL